MLHSSPVIAPLADALPFGERRADGVVAEEGMRDSKVRAETLHVLFLGCCQKKQLGLILFYL